MDIVIGCIIFFSLASLFWYFGDRIPEEIDLEKKKINIDFVNRQNKQEIENAYHGKINTCKYGILFLLLLSNIDKKSLTILG